MYKIERNHVEALIRMKSWCYEKVKAHLWYAVFINNRDPKDLRDIAKGHIYRYLSFLVNEELIYRDIRNYYGEDYLYDMFTSDPLFHDLLRDFREGKDEKVYENLREFFFSAFNQPNSEIKYVKDGIGIRHIEEV